MRGGEEQSISDDSGFYDNFGAQRPPAETNPYATTLEKALRIRQGAPIRKLTSHRIQVEEYVANVLLSDAAILQTLVNPTIQLDQFLRERGGVQTYLDGQFGLQEYIMKNGLLEKVQSLVSERGIQGLLRSAPVQSVHLPRCATPVLCDAEATCFGQDETMDLVYRLLSDAREEVQGLLETKPEVVSEMLTGLSGLTGMKAELLRAAPVAWIERSSQGVPKMRIKGYHRQGSRTCAPGQSDCNVVRLSANATIRYSGLQNRVHSFILLRLGVVIRLTDSAGRQELHPVNLADVVLPQYDDYRCMNNTMGGDSLERIGRDLQFQVEDLMDQTVAEEDTASWRLRTERLASLLALFETVLSAAQSGGGKAKSKGLGVDVIAGRFRRAGMSSKIAEVAAQLAVKGLKRARRETKMTKPKTKTKKTTKKSGAK
jgi:hypothetical protein